VPSRQESRALRTRRPKMPYVAMSAKIKKGTYQLPGSKNQTERSRRLGSPGERPPARLNKILGKNQILRETAKGVKEDSAYRLDTSVNAVIRPAVSGCVGTRFSLFFSTYTRRS